jgi:hypothetical protein
MDSAIRERCGTATRVKRENSEDNRVSRVAVIRGHTRKRVPEPYNIFHSKRLPLVSGNCVAIKLASRNDPPHR